MILFTQNKSSYISEVEENDLKYQKQQKIQKKIIPHIRIFRKYVQTNFGEIGGN